MDADTVAMMSMIMGSWVTIFAAILWQSNRHEDSIKALDTKVTTLDTRVTALDAKVDALDAKVDTLDGRVDGVESRFDKLDSKFDAMGRDVSDARERLARIEGYLMGPENFRMRSPQPSAGVDPSPDDPPDDHRQAS